MMILTCSFYPNVHCSSSSSSDEDEDDGGSESGASKSDEEDGEEQEEQEEEKEEKDEKDEEQEADENILGNRVGLFEGATPESGGMMGLSVVVTQLYAHARAPEVEEDGNCDVADQEEREREGV